MKLSVFCKPLGFGQFYRLWADLDFVPFNLKAGHNWLVITLLFLALSVLAQVKTATPEQEQKWKTSCQNSSPVSQILCPCLLQKALNQTDQDLLTELTSIQGPLAQAQRKMKSTSQAWLRETTAACHDLLKTEIEKIKNEKSSSIPTGGTANTALAVQKSAAESAADLQLTAREISKGSEPGKPYLVAVEFKNLGPDLAQNVRIDLTLLEGVNVGQVRTSMGKWVKLSEKRYEIQIPSIVSGKFGEIYIEAAVEKPQAVGFAAQIKSDSKDNNSTNDFVPRGEVADKQEVPVPTKASGN